MTLTLQPDRNAGLWNTQRECLERLAASTRSSEYLQELRLRLLLPENEGASAPSYLAPGPGLQGSLPPRPNGGQGGEVGVSLLDLGELQLLQLKTEEKGGVTQCAARRGWSWAYLCLSHIFKKADGKWVSVCVCGEQAVSGRHREVTSD